MEDKLKFIYENIQDVVWVLDIRTRKFTYVSPSIYNLRGYTSEEVMKQKIEDTLTPDSKSKIVGLLDILIKEFRKTNNKSIHIGEVEQYHKDGSTVWTEVVGTFITNEENNIVEILGVSRNITQRKKSQAKLEASERRYRDLANFLPQIVYELDNEGHITFSSQVGYDVFGITEEDIENHRVKAFDFFIPEDIERMKQNRENIKSGKKTNQEYTAVDKNGNQFPVIIYGSPIIENGETKGTRGIIIDISERKQMESALRKSEEKYRKLIHSLQEGLFVIQDGKFTYLNESVVKIVGYSVDELHGMDFLSVVAPQEREKIAENHIRRMRGEEVVDEFETLLFHKDNKTLIPTIISVCLTEYEGKTALIGTAKDISERYKSENELKDRERRLNAILDAALVGIALGDTNGKLLDFNQKWLELFGYSREEMLDITYQDVTFIDDLPKASHFYNSLIAGEIDYYNTEKRYIRKDGSLFWGQVSVRSIFDENNVIVGLVASIFDLTQRKQIEDELKMAQEKLKTELQKETIRSQFETLKNQVNPHFLFNSLNVLSSLIRIAPEVAEQFTAQLAKVYRYVLENKDKDTVTLATEIDFLHSYAFLLEIRFKDKVKIKIDIDNQFMERLIPTLALQLLIENAIKHNTFSKRTPLFISIFIDQNKFLSVENNFQLREENLIGNSTGVGLKNIANRYKFLTDEEPKFGVSGDKYIAKIPLL